MKNLSLIELADITASKEPVPGGGSISAVCGMLSGALTEMVANLTIGKKKYILVNAEMEIIKDKAHELRLQLLEDIEKDSVAFTLVMEAFNLPKDKDQEKQVRSQAIQSGLVEASKTPFEIASRAFQVMELAAVVVEKGNKNAITDGLVSLMLARTAVLGALLNVQVNLESIKDEEFVKTMTQQVNELKDKTIKLETNCLKDYSLI